jgi:hypothetical protein
MQQTVARGISSTANSHKKITFKFSHMPALRIMDKTNLERI